MGECEPCRRTGRGQCSQQREHLEKAWVWERPGVAKLQAPVQDVAKEDFLLH